MSRRLGVLIPTLAVCLAGPGAAQNLTRLERMWKDAAMASARIDSLARVRGRASLDSVRAGNIVVLAPPDLHATVGTAAARAWEQLRGIYGDEIESPAPPLIAALYRSDSGTPPYGFPPDAAPVPVASARPSASLLAVQLAVSLSQRFSAGMDQPLNRWLSTSIRPQAPDAPGPSLFEDLVTSPSPLARACYVGSLTACGQALGLVPPRDAATEWYDAAARRELVRSKTHYGRDPNVTLCIEQSVDEACIRLLRGADSTAGAPPLTPASREVILRMALRTGGPQAFHRLRGSTGQAIGRRLEVAAGIPLDSLLARWRSAVLGSRPVSVNLTAGTGWVALTWAVVLGSLVLGSTRWRS